MNEETAREFLRSQARWLRVDMQENPAGGWDIVLVIDGSFASREHAKEKVDYYAFRLANVLKTEHIPRLGPVP